jgi:PAS domain-containing protein
MLETGGLPDFIKRENLYDELPCGFLSYTPEGTLLDVNTTLANWLGQSREELLSQGFKSMLTKASLLYYNLFLDPSLRVKDLAEEINLQLVGPAGTFDVLFSGKSYKDSSGKTVLINATVLKIGNRKKYEAELLSEKRNAETQQSKLQFLINLVPIQIWTADPSGNVLTTNLQVKEYFGDLTVENETKFLGIFEEDRQAAFDDWQSSIKSGKIFEREARLIGVSNQPEWFLMRGQPYYNADDKIEMWFCCSVNINKKKLLQIANQAELKSNLSTAYETLNHHEARFSSIAFDQSHMVRKPLANILGLIKIINDNPEPDELSVMLSMLHESVQELDLMVNKVSKTIT